MTEIVSMLTIAVLSSFPRRISCKRVPARRSDPALCPGDFRRANPPGPTSTEAICRTSAAGPDRRFVAA